MAKLCNIDASKLKSTGPLYNLRSSLLQMASTWDNVSRDWPRVRCSGTASDQKKPKEFQPRTSSPRHFYLYEGCCQYTALEDRDRVRLQECGVSLQEVELIQSTIDSHFSNLRMCLMNSLIVACVLSVLGILIVLTGGEGRECGPYNCTLGSFVALAPWAFYAIFAVAYACCIVEAKNEKASSDLNLAFQDHPMRPHFRLASTMHRTHGVSYHDSTAYARHVLEISVRGAWACRAAKAHLPIFTKQII